jgi:aryl-alcohol dehydrogenase-like predicted oxidoreductase
LCGNWASASFPTHRSDTASSPARSAPPRISPNDDWRKNNPRFTEGNFEKNLRIVDEVKAVATELDATPAQIALAWLLAQGDDIAPIPGTKRVSRIEENTAADNIELSAQQIERLNNLSPATGKRHEDANMAVIDH